MIPSKPSPTLKDPSKHSDDFNDFLAKCVDKNPENRPKAEDLLKHPFITNSKGPEVMAPLVKETMKKIAEGALKDEDGDDDGTVKPGARPTALDDDEDGEEEGDYGTMLTNEEYGTMISNDGEGSEPDFMQMIRMGMGGKVTHPPTDAEICWTVMTN